jgi:hypothetical protein
MPARSHAAPRKRRLTHVAACLRPPATARAQMERTAAVETMNDWAKKTPLSPTLAIKDTADALRAAGTRLYDFGIGETNPEIPVPEIIKNTIASATLAEENHYSAAQGDSALLEAISEDLATNFDIPTSVDQLCVCPGPKDAIFKAAMAMTNGRSHRRRFICFAPIYESFISIPLLVSGEQPIVLQTDPKTFLPDPAVLRATLEQNDNICAVIVNSPNNPTGAVYPKELLAELAEVLKDHPEVWALSDEVYRTVSTQFSFWARLQIRRVCSDSPRLCARARVRAGALHPRPPCLHPPVPTRTDSLDLRHVQRGLWHWAAAGLLRRPARPDIPHPLHPIQHQLGALHQYRHPPRPPCVSAQPTRTAALARYRTATGRVWCMWA